MLESRYFQVFEKEWDEFVEIKDAVIADKAKVKAVVMPILGETCLSPSHCKFSFH